LANASDYVNRTGDNGEFVGGIKSPLRHSPGTSVSIESLIGIDGIHCVCWLVVGCRELLVHPLGFSGGGTSKILLQERLWSTCCELKSLVGGEGSCQAWKGASPMKCESITSPEMAQFHHFQDFRCELMEIRGLSSYPSHIPEHSAPELADKTD
ncbi:hypothetical protein ANCCAN_01767, partial [Ancylostoma caninum]